MKNRSRLVKLLIAFLLIFILLVAKNELANWQTKLLPKKSNQSFFSLNKEKISEIIFTGDTTEKIYKKNNRWYIKKNNFEFRADEEKIDQTITSFLKLKKENIVSNNKTKHHELGIAKQKIEIKTNGKTYTVFIGKTFGLSGNYVRLDNENEVFTAEGFNGLLTTQDFRDLSLHFVTNESELTLLQIEDIRLDKKDSNWKIDTKTAKKDRVDFYINDLKTLKATDILTSRTELPASIPFTIKVIESKKEKTLFIYQLSENSYLAKISVSDYIYQIPAAYVASLKKEVTDFLE